MTIRLERGKKEKGESDKLQKVVIHGHFDKQETINELEDFAARSDIGKSHPDMRVEYQKHCDGWRGIIVYEDKSDPNNENDDAGKLLTAIDKHNRTHPFTQQID